MPLVKRSIEPQFVSRVVVAQGVRNELEFVSNSTLANVIQQLSSLSKHAQDLFNELHRETSCVFYRNCKLNERIDRLKQKIQQLNPVKDSVSLQDMNQRKPFKSSVTKEQQILTLQSRPQAIAETYAECEPPPPLNKLDAYREDGKDSVKFYTDPGYFLELWCQEMVRDADNQPKKQKHRNKRTRPVKDPRTIRAPKSHLDEFKERRHGPEFVGSTISRESNYQGYAPVNGQALNRPGSLEITTLPHQPNQWDIVGHGFQTSDYGPGLAGNGAVRNSLTDSVLRYAAENNMPGYNQGGMEFAPPNSYQEDAVSNHIDSPVSKGTPNKRKQPTDDSISRPYANQYGDRFGMNDARGQAARDTMSPRPTMPPPAPPEASDPRRGNAMAMRSGSIVNRDNLPPPPPTPVQQVTRSESSASRSSRSSRSTYSPTRIDYSSLPDPVPMAMAISPKGKHNTSFDLPPPPTPPSPHTIDQLPSPTPIPPPPIDDLKDTAAYTVSPPPPPLPPPLDLGDRLPIRKDVKQTVPDWENNNEVLPVDSASLRSDSSSATASSKTEEQGKLEKPAVRDTRSDLLSAIRTGINLRKVEERRLKTEQKQKTAVRLDVQAIMEAAFERRRKALEDNDSENDEDGDAEDNWSDDG